MFHTYILYSQKLGRYYAGFTGDSLESRLKKHCANHKGFSGKADDWQYVYTEKFDSKPEAMAREIEIKKWKSRKKIEQLINAS